MTTLAEFLLARIAEDQEEALADARSTHGPWDPARALAECEAKRRIMGRLADLGAHLADTGRQMPDMRSALLVDGILADLALPYADHADYRPEWRP